MKRIKNHIKQLFVPAILCLTVWGLSSCVGEDIEHPCKRNGDYLSVRLRLPGDPISYTLREPDENEIRELDVLVFRQNTDGKEYCMSRVTVDRGDITTDAGDASGRTKSCTVEVPVGGSFKQRLVFVANAQKAVDDAIKTFGASALKERMLSGIVFDIKKGSWPAEGNWPAKSSATFIPFPMWGESKLLNLPAPSGAEPVCMMRMVARVDMKVAVGLQSDFELHEVYLYNRYETGLAVPSTGVLTGSGNILKVSDVSVPLGAVPVTKPKDDEFYTTDDGQLRSVTQSIYLMENSPTTQPLEATCFVVGGKHKESDEVRYWRADLPKQGSTQLADGFRTFLRNHCYEVVIKAVNSNGYGTPDDAFYKRQQQVDVDVTVWNLVDVVFEDQKRFSLRASPAAHHYIRSGGQGEFSVWTDYWKSATDQGWTGTIHFAAGDDGSWLQFDPSPPVFSGAKGENKTYKFEVRENTTGQGRQAYLKIRAGNLVKYVDIYQINQVGLTMNWVESGQGDSPFNEPYRLGVSHTHVIANVTAATTVRFQITTDRKDGYTTQINGGAGADWITVNSGGSSNGPVTGREIVFTVTDNPHSVSRSAVVDVRAGNLVKRVRVTQFDRMGGEVDLSMNWVESSQGDSPLGGPYRLGVERLHFDLLKNARSGLQLPIAASHPSGYSAKVTRGGSWITITGNGASTNAWPIPAVMTFAVGENNEADTRVGEICITSGGLKKYITVSQSVIAGVSTGGSTGGWEDKPGDDPVHGPYSITFDKQSFVCSGVRSPLATLVTATASTAGVNWTAVANDNWIILQTSSGSANGSAQTLAFVVAENPGTTARNGSITVSVIHRGNKIEKMIHVKQFGASVPMVWTEDLSGRSYKTNQLTRHSFTLHSRMDWAVRVKSGGDPSGILRTLYTTGGKAGEAGERVWFALNTFSVARRPATGSPPYTVTLEVYSPRDEFPPMYVAIKAVF